jgi:uncharacterized protein YjbI with pentapeptide repeats
MSPGGCFIGLHASASKRDPATRPGIWTTRLHRRSLHGEMTAIGAGRRWTALELKEVLARLRADGTVDGSDVDFTTEDVDQLMEAAPRVDDRPHFAQAKFRKARFSSAAYFGWASFGNATDFSGATFGEGVSFHDAIFGDEATFAAAKFGDNANFTRAILGDKANFTAARFGFFADFDGAIFGYQAIFGAARFGDLAKFGGTFGDSAMFAFVTFGAKADFGGVAFGDRADFAGATFGNGADFGMATFGKGADFLEAQLEGASLAKATLGGSRLNRARFDYRTSLEEARLFTFADPKGNIKTCASLLGDIRWNGVQVSGVADWRYAQEPRLGDDPFGAWPASPGAWIKNTRFVRWVSRTEATSASVELDRQFEPDPIERDPADRLDAAIRAYRQVSTLLEGQGMSDVAQEYDYRASQLSRRQRRGLARFALWALDGVAGYGYRPLRVFITYLVTVGVFAVLYGISNTTKWQDALQTSFLAFHGRGITMSSLVQGRWELTLPAAEAAIGLFVEALVVATIIRRLFRR